MTGEIEELEDGINLRLEGTETTSGEGQAGESGTESAQSGQANDPGPPAPPTHTFRSVVEDGTQVCWVYVTILESLYIQDVVLYNLADSRANAVPQCPSDPGRPALNADDLRQPLIAEAVEQLPLPLFEIQPGNRPLVGKPSYLQGGMPMEWRPGSRTLTFVNSTATATVELSADVVEYWVDWDWQPGDEFFGHTHDPYVTGPHYDAPYGWHDDNHGNVGFTYQTSGTRQVAVMAQWKVSGNVTFPDLGAMTPATVTVGPTAVTVEVRQAQSVRES